MRSRSTGHIRISDYMQTRYIDRVLRNVVWVLYMYMYMYLAKKLVQHNNASFVIGDYL